MAEFPALPIFTDAYLADTRHLSAAQHGAYLLLLMMAWRLPDCALPDNDETLAKWCSMDKRTFLKNKDAIMSFWTRNDAGKFVQKRLLDERKYVEHKRNKNSEAGKASALKRQNRGSTNVQPKVNETSTPTPTPTPNIKTLQKGYDFSDDVLQAWRKAYPNVDIDTEIAKAFAWETSNPKNTKKNKERFVNSWLSRAKPSPAKPKDTSDNMRLQKELMGITDV